MAPTCEVVLVRAPNDQPSSSADYQAELKAFHERLRSAGVSVSPAPPKMAFDSAHPPDPSTLTDFLVTLAPQVVPVFTAIAGAWAQARFGQKVRLKVGDIEAEASTAEELERLIAHAVALKNTLKGSDEPWPSYQQQVSLWRNSIPWLHPLPMADHLAKK
jgi:hypothetical protein